MKIEKNARDRKKLEKAGKGSFKFRLKPEEIEEKRQLLDKGLETLEAQVKILQSLQSPSINQ